MSTFQKKTVTLTWGCQAENHVGMQKIGKLAENGFNLIDGTNCLCSLNFLVISVFIFMSKCVQSLILSERGVVSHVTF